MGVWPVRSQRGTWMLLVSETDVVLHAPDGTPLSFGSIVDAWEYARSTGHYPLWHALVAHPPAIPHLVQTLPGIGRVKYARPTPDIWPNT